MSRVLLVIAWGMGLACVAIGVLHFALGVHSVPGEGAAGATVDSRERFYGAIFGGYGLAWVWAARQRPLPLGTVRALTLVFLVGGAGRILSLVVAGRPQWFQLVLTVIELALPVAVLLVLPRASDDTTGVEVPR